MKSYRKVLSRCLSLLLVQQLVQPMQTAFAEGTELYPSASPKLDVATSYLKNNELATMSSNVSGSSPGYLSQLVNESLPLLGVDRSQELFYTVPQADVGNGSYIELDISYSDLLLSTKSTLTVSVDDRPLKSIFLSNEAGPRSKIRIPLGSEEVTPGFHRISITKHSIVSDDYCSDDANPANWLKVNRSSAVFIDTRSTWTTSNVLQQYPTPFVEQGTQDELYGAILLPDHPSSELVSSGLEIASYFSTKTSSAKPTRFMTESEWLNQDRLVPVVALGGINDWTGPIKQMIVESNIQARNGQLSLDSFVVKDQQKGESRQVLLASAESAKVIRDNIHILSKQEFIDQLSGNHLSIKEMQRKQVNGESPKPLTFESLGYQDVMLDDVTRESPKLNINIPSYWKLSNESDLRLKVRISPLLLDGLKEQKNKRNQESVTNQEVNGLTVHINGIPKTIAFSDLEKVKKENDSYIVQIPISQYMKVDTANALTVSFTANFNKAYNACVRDPNNGRWIFIDKESSVQIPHEILKESSFKYWPAPFVGDNGLERTLFVLPKEVNGDMLTQLSTLALNMTGQTKGKSGYEVIRESDPGFDQKLQNHHLVIIGNPNQYEFMTEVKDKLLVKSESEQVNLANYNIINETTNYAAWIQPSVWDKNSVMAIFQSGQSNKTGAGAFVHDKLLQYLDKEHKTSQIVVMSKSDEVLSIDVQKEEHVEAVQRSRPEQTNTTLIWMTVIVVLLFAVGMFVFIRMWRRPK